MNIPVNHKCRVYVFAVAIFILSIGVVHGLNGSEMDKIQYLINSVNELKGAKFIRNGTEYDAGSAASHLQLKLKAAGSKVKTAEDFIQLCATGSSVTGKPYLIRLTDGTILKSETFFRSKLKSFPHPVSAP